MGKFYDSINSDLQEWALAQAMFFVASAPTHGAHVNVSPKGLPSSTFTIWGPNKAGYIDATGSGNETMSHIRENGRVTVMFCSFGPAPKILRFYCWGRVVEWDQKDEFDRLSKEMVEKGNKVIPAARTIVLLDVFKVGTSCGFGVPLLAMKPDPKDSSKNVAYLKDRETLGHFSEKVVAQGKLQEYQEGWNVESLDGLPGLRSAMRGKSGKVRLLLEDARTWRARHRDLLLMLSSTMIGMVLAVVLLQVLGLTTVDLEEWRKYARQIRYY